MATPIFCCGFECQTTSVVAPTLKHWNQVYGVVQNTIARNSGYAAEFDTTATAGYATHETGARACVVARVYIYFPELPGGDLACITQLQTLLTNWAIGYTSATGKLSIGTYGGARTDGVTTVVAATWHRLDAKIVPSVVPAGNTTIDWQLDGTDQGQFIGVENATTVYSFSLNNPNANSTQHVIFDDVLLSSAAADYPWGPGTIKGYAPTSDGTHSVT